MGIVENLNEFTNNLTGAIVLAILAIATLITVLDWCGFLPSCVSRFVFRHRINEIKSILKDMGVDFTEEKKNRLLNRLNLFFNDNKELTSEVKNIISRNLKKGRFDVGKTRIFQVNGYADLMSASCNPQEAKLIARCLSTFLAAQNSSLSNPGFDFVATPKSGSPIIGYELSNLINKPLILHDCNETKYRTTSEEHDALSRIDCYIEIKPGMIGLVVDDSTTGGRKVNSLVNDLRKLGCIVGDCLVVFEPQGKSGNNLLSSNGVRLHSILKR